MTDVKAVRERYRLTQAQVAARAGVKQPEVSAVENGTRSTPGARERTLKAIRDLAQPSVGLTAEVRAQTLEAFKRYGASEIRVFGSVARGTDRPGSDIDFIAKFPTGFSLFSMFDLQDELEDIIGLPVDVVSDDPRGGQVLTAINSDAVPFVAYIEVRSKVAALREQLRKDGAKGDDFWAAEMLTCVYSADKIVDRGEDVFFEEGNTVEIAAARQHIIDLDTAADGLSPEFKDNHPGIPWKQLARMRDRNAYHYDDVNRDIVWNVLVVEFPKIRLSLRQHLGI